DRTGSQADAEGDLSWAVSVASAIARAHQHEVDRPQRSVSRPMPTAGPLTCRLTAVQAGAAPGRTWSWPTGRTPPARSASTCASAGSAEDTRHAPEAGDRDSTPPRFAASGERLPAHAGRRLDDGPALRGGGVRGRSRCASCPSALVRPRGGLGRG